MQAKTERFEMRLDPSILERVDDWRRGENDLPSRSEAIRRLVEVGLGSKQNKQLQISDGERLTLLLLCGIARKLGIKEGPEPDFIESVLHGGHLWGLRWKYSGIFHGHADDDQTVSEVTDILDMWEFLESGFNALGVSDKERVKTEAAPFGDRVSFPGFDGNNESSYMGVASFLIEKLERFTRFRERAHLNSHMPTLAGYRRMLAVFLPIRATLIGSDLSAAQIIMIINARRQPDGRSAAAI